MKSKMVARSKRKEKNGKKLVQAAKRTRSKADPQFAQEEVENLGL